MAVWRIREKGTTQDGRLYLLVDIWFGADATGSPDLTNDFVLDIPEFEYPINKRESDGAWELLDGTFVRENVARTMDVSEFKRTETRVDCRARVSRTIAAYIGRATARNERGNKIDPAITRDATDRRNQLSTIEESGIR